MGGKERKSKKEGAAGGSRGGHEKIFLRAEERF